MVRGADLDAVLLEYDELLEVDRDDLELILRYILKRTTDGLNGRLQGPSGNASRKKQDKTRSNGSTPTSFPSVKKSHFEGHRLAAPIVPVSSRLRYTDIYGPLRNDVGFRRAQLCGAADRP